MTSAGVTAGLSRSVSWGQNGQIATQPRGDTKGKR